MLNNFRAMGRLSTLIFSLIFLFQLTPQSAYAQPNGEQLFKGNCASCHRATEERMTGPGLKGATERWAGKEALLHQWVKNPASVISQGDPYVKSLVSEYASSGIMPAQAVTDEEIDAIFAYVNSYTPPVAVVEEETSTAGEGESDNTVWYLIIGSLLLIVIFSIAGVRRSLYNAIAERKGLPTTDGLTYWQSAKLWIARNKVLTLFIIIFLVVMGLKDTWDGLASIGVYQGYKPEQPINFSHKIHAGQNQINCVYCHSSAEKSKHAGIPSANVCMNCHATVSSGKVTGTKEIAKIYDAVGWDPEKRAYTGEAKPIKWIKIHNLPDHAYFNHSQHVAVGKLACQECHGEVQEMDVVEQHAPLTMGWCINCHGEKEVDMASNGYYQEIHARMTKAELKSYLNDDQKITVEDLGGWECSKCHY